MSMSTAVLTMAATQQQQLPFRVRSDRPHTAPTFQAPQASSQASQASQASHLSQASTPSSARAHRQSSISHASPSKSHSRESRESRDEVRGEYHRQSIEVIKNVDGDVDAFIKEVVIKRRQLDDQIHRYIKQKEREFKFFERDTRIKYRSAGANHSLDGASSPQGPQTRLDESGLAEPRVARERDVDYVGIFTPDYLPLFRGKAAQAPTDPEGADAASAPSSAGPSGSLQKPSDQRLLRSNSDPSDEKQPSSPARVRLKTRTSSSGSDAKSLVSALKSPLPNAKLPKRKRVSLVVGDEVVAPNDSVPEDDNDDDDNQESKAALFAKSRARYAPSRDNSSTPDDDSRQNVEPEELTLPQSHNLSDTSDMAGSLPASLPIAFNQPGISRLSSAERHKAPSIENVTSPKISEPGVFSFSDNDLVADEMAKQPLLAKDDEMNTSLPDDLSPTPFMAIAQTSQITSHTAPISPPSSIASKVIPPARRKSPYTGFMSTSGPGYARPSVLQDPVMDDEDDGNDPEVDYNSELGSYAVSYPFRPGSLGESYMERNSLMLQASGRRRSSAAVAASPPDST